MCLSTPTPTKPESQGANSACRLDTMCSGSTNSVDAQLKHRVKATDAKQTKATTEPDQDTLGYVEENAVYKENEAKLKEEKKVEKDQEYNPQIRWPDLCAQTFLHVGALYGLYLMFYAKFYTFLWGRLLKSHYKSYKHCIM